ncbi:MAG: hypothetical protein ABSF69_10915 [Polyangiaceae bacterium]
MTQDLFVVVALVVAFAALVTVHVTLIIGLTRRRPRWRAIVALFVVPLAPWWGWQQRMRLRAAIWIVAAVAYAVALSAARR